MRDIAFMEVVSEMNTGMLGFVILSPAYMNYMNCKYIKEVWGF